MSSPRRPLVARIPILALFRKDDRFRSRLDELCEFAPESGTQEELVFWFIQLVRWLRPREGQRADAKLRFLATQFERHPEWRARTSAALGALLRQTDVGRLLAYGGIPIDFHFGGAVKEWFLVKILPTACKTQDGAQILRLAFEEADLDWLARREVLGFFRSLVDPALAEPLAHALTEALVDLAHQLVAQAHAPTVRALARVDRSPYRGLYESVVAFDADPGNLQALHALEGRIRQCVLSLGAHREELGERGASVNTTFQLTRMRQQLDRLARLAALRHDTSDAALADAARVLVGSILRSVSAKRLVTRSSDLLVQNLVDSAATVGRTYLEDERSSFRAAFRAGAGGGLLMALATIVKFFLAGLHLPALYEGLVFSLNYATAFCAAYLLHYTIATKLPAHTAAALARSAQHGASHSARLGAFMTVWSSTLRLQIAGLLGNVVVAGPLAFGIDLAVRRTLGHSLISVAKGEHVLAAQSVLGPSILYAALTGLFLWISSLIGAFADNWARVHRLADRLATNQRVMKRLGAAQARGLADAFVARAGGLAGNVALGFLLGAVPAAFAIAHLPVEIRHITVSTSSVALAIGAGAGTRGDVALAALGLVVIAFVNVAVSFVLALGLALRATKGMRASASTHAVVRLGLGVWTLGAKRRKIHRAARVRAARRSVPEAAPVVLDT